MNTAMAGYVRVVDAVNYRLGRVMMYGVYVMMAILLWSSISKTFFLPSEWTLEMAQFAMVAYYLLGGGYSMQMGSHVRMDLLYTRWSPRTRSAVDAITVLFLIFYLALLLYGGFSSTEYALKYGERGFSAWRPYMAPIKIIMCIGITLVLLQAIAMFFRNFAEARGIPIDGGKSEAESAI